VRQIYQAYVISFSVGANSRLQGSRSERDSVDIGLYVA